MNGIIVGLDRTPASAAALRWAVDHGARHGLPVTGLLGWQHDTAGADIARLVADAVGDENEVRHRLSAEPLNVALLAATQAADLVVVGAHHQHWLRDLVHASPCHDLVRQASCPLAVVRERPLDEEAPIVVGLDGSGAAGDALRWAIADADLDRMIDDAAGADEPIERRSEYGPTVDVLCEIAEHAAVLVVGSRQTGAGHHLLEADVSRSVAERAPSTVVIVPPRSR